MWPTDHLHFHTHAFVLPLVKKERENEFNSIQFDWEQGEDAGKDDWLVYFIFLCWSSIFCILQKQKYGYLEQNEDAWGGGKNWFILYL